MKMGPEKGPVFASYERKTGSNFLLDEAIEIVFTPASLTSDEQVVKPL